MQNHLLQILALFAMERPVSTQAEDIRNEKVINCMCVSTCCRVNSDVAGILGFGG